MRFLLPWLVLVSCAATFDAQACKVPTDYQRAAVSAEYDARHRDWIASIAQRLVADPDPQIAWTGVMLRHTSSDAPLPEATPLPPLPTTRAGRLMRYLACDEGQRCPEALSQWLDAEPDNAFVIALAMGDEHGHGRDDDEDDDTSAPTDALRARLARATRYEDGYFAVRELVDQIAARFDLTPPPTPPGYTRPPCSYSADTSFSALMDAVAIPTLAAPRGLLHGPPLEREQSLRLADLLIAAPRSPTALRIGAELGMDAATDTIDRERYCRIEARMHAQEDVLEWLLTEPDARRRGYLRQFDQALRTRNLVDATDAIAPGLPADRRPDPVDLQRVADCVARRE